MIYLGRRIRDELLEQFTEHYSFMIYWARKACPWWIVITSIHLDLLCYGSIVYTCRVKLCLSNRNTGIEISEFPVKALGEKLFWWESSPSDFLGDWLPMLSYRQKLSSHIMKTNHGPFIPIACRGVINQSRLFKIDSVLMTILCLNKIDLVVPNSHQLQIMFVQHCRLNCSSMCVGVIKCNSCSCE